MYIHIVYEVKIGKLVVKYQNLQIAMLESQESEFSQWNWLFLLFTYVDYDLLTINY